jgi:hypothetical protein
MSILHFKSARLWILVFWLVHSDGDQKLRTWLGDPSWIAGMNPPSRFFPALTSFNDELYLFGGATSFTGNYLVRFFYQDHD